MGLNLVIGCEKHRTRRWIGRGHEREGVVSFYREHWTCQPGGVVLSDDQRSDPWVNDEEWTEESYWGADRDEDNIPLARPSGPVAPSDPR